MIHPPENNEWAWKGANRPSLFLPWFTRPFLDVLERMDLKGKCVLEWGMGWGSLWLAAETGLNGMLVSIENNPEWHGHISQQHRQEQGHLCAHLRVTADTYSLKAGCADLVLPNGWVAERFDIIIIDGEFRQDCAQNVPNLIKPGGIVILDNADEYPEIVEMFSREERHCFPQPGHPTWRTDYWVWRNVPPAPSNTTQASHEQKIRRGLVQGP